VPVRHYRKAGGQSCAGTNGVTVRRHRQAGGQSRAGMSDVTVQISRPHFSNAFEAALELGNLRKQASHTVPNGFSKRELIPV
jgi:hypothetical protein